MGDVLKKPLFNEGKKFMSDDHPMKRKTGEASQPPASSSTTSDTTAVQEVHQAIRAELAKGLRSLSINPDLH